MGRGEYKRAGWGRGDGRGEGGRVWWWAEGWGADVLEPKLKGPVMPLGLPASLIMPPKLRPLSAMGIFSALAPLNSGVKVRGAGMPEWLSGWGPAAVSWGRAVRAAGMESAAAGVGMGQAVRAAGTDWATAGESRGQALSAAGMDCAAEEEGRWQAVRAAGIECCSLEPWAAR